MMMILLWPWVMMLSLCEPRRGARNRNVEPDVSALARMFGNAAMVTRTLEVAAGTPMPFFLHAEAQRRTISASELEPCFLRRKP